ncbi:hypothetical protein A1F94_010252 [Pyrenophora tritici-repentis]|nr:hypothetical protein A1F94_010252 [Pyrenophora tritici-repentis]
MDGWVPAGPLPAIIQQPAWIAVLEVQAPSQDGEGLEIVPVDGAAAWARVGEQMAKAWADIEKGADDDPGGRARRGEPMAGADAVVAVPSGHGEGFVSVHRGARGRARCQAGAAGRAGGSSDLGSHGWIGAVQPGIHY